tara:strand:+ start:71 stop:1234 length:1164 start_codon:yes stop_codon:yes gene_type:complete
MKLMHKFIIFLLLFISCSNSSEDIVETIEPTTSTSTTTFSPDSTSFSQTIIIPNTSTTTTTVPQSTTSPTSSQETSTPTPSESTANNSAPEIKLPEISISNCPDSNIDQDSYELLWSITAGSFDVDYVRISYWINGEYFSRVYYEKSQLNDTFPFPVAGEKIVYSQSLDFNDSDDYETLEVFFSISDESESFFEIEEKCTFYFNNTPLVSTTTTVPQSTTSTSTTTTSSTTTTVPETTTTTSSTTTTVPETTTTTSSTTTTSTTTTSSTTTTTTVPQSIINVEVTVGIGDSGQNVYFLNGSQETILNVATGNIYRFNQSDTSNSNHPLRFSESQEGSEYSSNVTSSGVPGNSGSYVEIEITSNTPNKLYLICLNHYGMGGNSEIIKN